MVSLPKDDAEDDAVTNSATADTDAIWAALAEVADPEVPVLSVVDLGIVRAVEAGPPVTVTISPTYTGCPATEIIGTLIREKLAEAGFPGATVRQSIVPPWTTDWISEEGRAKLKAYGIAPPKPRAANSGPIRCPRCDSPNTKRVSEFGSTPCKALWRCTDCLEPFDHFKCL